MEQPPTQPSPYRLLCRRPVVQGNPERESGIRRHIHNVTKFSREGVASAQADRLERKPMQMKRMVRPRCIFHRQLYRIGEGCMTG